MKKTEMLKNAQHQDPDMYEKGLHKQFRINIAQVTLSDLLPGGEENKKNKIYSPFLT